MKTVTQVFSFLLITSMVLLLFKPLFPHTLNKPDLLVATETSKECPYRTSLASACQTSMNYTLAENSLQCGTYLFIIAGIVFFVLIQLISNSPHKRLFKPPIILC